MNEFEFLGVCASLDDIPLEMANAAHAGTSFSPEKRAAAERAEYLAHLRQVGDTLAPLADTDEKRALLAAEFARYRDGYLSRTLAALGARSRCLSTMIAGGSNFPVRRAEKANDTYQRRIAELLDYARSRPARIKRLLTRGPRSGAESEIEQLQGRITALELQQARMKATNKALRSKTPAEALATLGYDEGQIIELLKPRRTGELGHPAYELTNNNAHIRRLKARLTELQEKAALVAEAPQEQQNVNGVLIVKDREADRLQLIFPVKPDEPMRSSLKARGFRWSPSNGAWQRQLTLAAEQAARQLLGKPTP